MDESGAALNTISKFCQLKGCNLCSIARSWSCALSQILSIMPGCFFEWVPWKKLWNLPSFAGLKMIFSPFQGCFAEFCWFVTKAESPSHQVTKPMEPKVLVLLGIYLGTMVLHAKWLHFVCRRDPKSSGGGGGNPGEVGGKIVAGRNAVNLKKNSPIFFPLFFVFWIF